MFDELVNLMNPILRVATKDLLLRLDGLDDEPISGSKYNPKGTFVQLQLTLNALRVNAELVLDRLLLNGVLVENQQGGVG